VSQCFLLLLSFVLRFFLVEASASHFFILNKIRERGSSEKNLRIKRSFCPKLEILLVEGALAQQASFELTRSYAAEILLAESK
jgi:hypothetical protein